MSSYQNIDSFLQFLSTYYRSGSEMENLFRTDEELTAAREMTMSRNKRGETPLLIALAHSQDEIFEFLIYHLKAPRSQIGNFFWNEREYPNVTPLMAGMISNQLFCFSRLIDEEEDNPCASLKSIMSSSMSRCQKIDALELVGSAYILYDCDTASYGIPYLRQGLVLRQSTDDGQPAIPKIIQPLSTYTRYAFGNSNEVTTLEQLDQVVGDYHQLFLQAFLISKRIIYQLVPGTYYFFLDCIGSYAYKCQRDRNYKRANRLRMLVLEPFQHSQWESLNRKTHISIKNLLEEMSHNLEDLFGSPAVYLQVLTFTDVMFILKFAFAHVTRTLQAEKEEDLRDRTKVTYIFDLILLACELLPKSSKLQSLDFKRDLAQYIQFEKNIGLLQHPLLHVACNQDVIPIHLIELLLALGADPNGTDNYGKTPLHLITMKKSWQYMQRNIKAIEILINNGAHIDYAHCCTRLTPQRIFQDHERKFLRSTGVENRVPLHPLFNIVLPLTCQSALAIRIHRIFFKGQLPPIPPFLHEIVQRH